VWRPRGCRRKSGELGFTELPCSVKDLDDIEANILLLSSNQQEGNDPLDIGLNALDSITASKGGRGVKSELSVTAFARRIGKTHQFVSLTMKGGEVYKKLATQVAGFESDYRQACADKLMSPTHLREMDVPDSALELTYRLTKEQKWTKEATKAAADRIRAVSDLVPEWLPDISSVYPKVAMEPGYAKSTAACCWRWRVWAVGCGSPRAMFQPAVIVIPRQAVSAHGWYSLCQLKNSRQIFQGIQMPTVNIGTQDISGRVLFRTVRSVVPMAVAASVA
jgi:hypothetical protein